MASLRILIVEDQLVVMEGLSHDELLAPLHSSASWGLIVSPDLSPNFYHRRRSLYV
jgi:hypothetical protein